MIMKPAKKKNKKTMTGLQNVTDNLFWNGSKSIIRNSVCLKQQDGVSSWFGYQEKFEVTTCTVKNEKGQNYENQPYGPLQSEKF